jgi:hypothetical protein
VGLKNQNIKPVYNSMTDNIIDDFYIPVLKNTKIYKRISAYFNSKILSLYSRGIEQIVNKQGHIFFIFSCQLNEEDFFEIKRGYDERNRGYEKIVESLSADEITNEIKNLGFLIKHGYVDIKIAFTKSNGIFHDKFGLMENEEDVVYFRGSNNETVASISSNYESFETSCSWKADENEKFKIASAQKSFESLWSNTFSDDIIVVDFPDVLREKLISYSSDRIILTNHPKNNCYILDFETSLIGINKLDNPTPLLPQSNFFKMEMEAYISCIKDNCYIFSDSMNYLCIQRLISRLLDYASRFNFQLHVTSDLKRHLYNKDIQIDKRRSLGIAIKNKHHLLDDDMHSFREIVNNEMERRLREPQMWAAYHLTRMQRGANFSVPGSGKTSVVYGAFSYLNSQQIGEINKIVMIGPINSFSSWEIEFKECFGSKKNMVVYNHQKNKDLSRVNSYDTIVHNSKDCNLFLFNYESLNSNLDALSKIIDERTLLVFDEVHRIKAIVGKRAADAKEICTKAKYRVVLTGTPIPNGYVDIFNMLNILFSDEYDDFFGFDESFLGSAKADENKQAAINNKIFPFFCRTNKNDLFVPPAEPDDIKKGYCIVTAKEARLFEILYKACSGNFLLLYVRLMQAATNPSLLLKNLNQYDIDSFGVEINDERMVLDSEDYNFINSFNMTSKFWRGIELIKERIKNGPIIVWGIFIDTISKICTELNRIGIPSKTITGNVPIQEREEIIDDFRSGKLTVLVTNPHTLGESISLHKICHQAIYFEYSFNLVHMIQSKDRIHRLGLNEGDKTEYFFLMLDYPEGLFPPIDKKIYYRLLEKENLQTRALSSENIHILIDNLEDDIKEVLIRK